MFRSLHEDVAFSAGILSVLHLHSDDLAMKLLEESEQLSDREALCADMDTIGDDFMRAIDVATNG